MRAQHNTLIILLLQSCFLCLYSKSLEESKSDSKSLLSSENAQNMRSPIFGLKKVRDRRPSGNDEESDNTNEEEQESPVRATAPFTDWKKDIDEEKEIILKTITEGQSMMFFLPSKVLGDHVEEIFLLTNGSLIPHKDSDFFGARCNMFSPGILCELKAVKLPWPVEWMYLMGRLNIPLPSWMPRLPKFSRLPTRSFGTELMSLPWPVCS